MFLTTQEIVQSNTNDALHLKVSLPILFIVHFALSIVTTYYLYIDGFIISFWYSLSPILLLYVLGWCLIFYVIVDETDDDLFQPLASCILIAYFITAEKYSYDCGSCANLNDKYKCCTVFNYVIIFLTLPLFVILTPLYSISNIMLSNSIRGMMDFWIYYQWLSVGLSTLVQIIIFCISMHSLPLIAKLFMMISIQIGIIYSIIMIFLTFDGKKGPNFTPLMIVIECLLLLNMISVVAYIGLSDFTKIETIVLLITFINVVTLNLPFYKTYAVHKYIQILKTNPCLEFVADGTNSDDRLNRMLCVILSNDLDGHDWKENPRQATFIQQYKFIKEKRIVIGDRTNYDNGWILKKVYTVLYILLSAVAMITPFSWTIWISVQKRFDNDSLSQYGY